MSKKMQMTDFIKGAENGKYAHLMEIQEYHNIFLNLMVEDAADKLNHSGWDDKFEVVVKNGLPANFSGTCWLLMVVFLRKFNNYDWRNRVLAEIADRAAKTTAPSSVTVSAAGMTVTMTPATTPK